MKISLLQTLIQLTLGMIILAVFLWVIAPTRGAVIELAPAPTPAPILVHLDGAVQQPGVYSLAANSRLGDAIGAAGGLRPDANTEAVNLAARLKDGEKIIVPIQGTPVVSRSPGLLTENEAPQTDLPEGETLQVVNLNTASLEELQTLPNIGPSRAEDIIAYRNANNGFKTIDEIQNVTGIGPATFEKLKDWIAVE